MTRTFMPNIKTAEELENHQLKGLQWTVQHAYDGSPFYRNKLDEGGVRPQGIRSLEDLQKLPFTT
ncbi:MAG: phenylacetate--CoA ligase family protein, partial [Deltaproteobacteria bacterium]|nr:phenylacetate--CoA ligase family protein [Deltaproteobacteria bacterium]